MWQSMSEHKRATWLNHISSNASSSDLEGCAWIACVIWDQVKDIPFEDASEDAPHSSGYK